MRPRARTILRRTLSVVIAIPLALFALVQFQQRLLRHRAEKLHAEVVALQLHPGTFADIQRLQKEWGRFAHYDGECTEHHCIYQVSIRDFSGFLNGGAAPRYFRPWMYRVYEILGGRGTKYFVELRLRDNRMWKVGDGVGVEVVLNGFEDFSYLLAVESNFGTRLFDLHGRYSPSALERGYTIGRPGGCTGCIVGWIDFAPEAPVSDVNRITAINFSCITQRAQCLSLGDLIPSAWSDASNTDKHPALDEYPLKCTSTLEQYAREANNIAIVEVVSTTQATVGRDGQFAKLRILRRLKNAEALKPGSEFSLPISSNTLIPGRSSSASLVRGSQYFLLPRERIMEALPCTIAPFSESALIAVQLGIKEDASTGEPYSWKDEQHTY